MRILAQKLPRSKRAKPSAKVSSPDLAAAARKAFGGGEGLGLYADAPNYDKPLVQAVAKEEDASSWGPWWSPVTWARAAAYAACCGCLRGRRGGEEGTEKED